MGCGLQSFSASFLSAVTPSAGVGLLLGLASCCLAGWLEGHGMGSSLHGLRVPLTYEGSSVVWKRV